MGYSDTIASLAIDLARRNTSQASKPYTNCLLLSAVSSRLQRLAYGRTLQTQQNNASPSVPRLPWLLQTWKRVSKLSDKAGTALYSVSRPTLRWMSIGDLPFCPAHSLLSPCMGNDRVMRHGHGLVQYSQSLHNKPLGFCRHERTMLCYRTATRNSEPLHVSWAWKRVLILCFGAFKVEFLSDPPLQTVHEHS